MRSSTAVNGEDEDFQNFFQFSEITHARPDEPNKSLAKKPDMDTIPIDNLFENMPSQLASEWFQEIVRGKRFFLQRIVSENHHTNHELWYDQPETEWVAVLSGGACIEFEQSGQSVELKPGDHLTIPAHARHRILWTSRNEKTVWLAIHFEQ